jgi:N-acetylglutamate synthase-like GNAT family acetyltransferase
MADAIRRAGSTDAKAVRELTRAVYAKWIAVIGREPFPMAADYDAAVVAHWIDLLEDDGVLLGLVEMIPREDHLFIENLAVAEVAQGRGLGGRLLAHAEDVARGASFSEVRLSTNAAFLTNLIFYEKRGFEVVERKTLSDGGTMVMFRKVLPGHP